MSLYLLRIVPLFPYASASSITSSELSLQSSSPRVVFTSPYWLVNVTGTASVSVAQNIPITCFLVRPPIFLPLILILSLNKGSPGSGLSVGVFTVIFAVAFPEVAFPEVAFPEVASPAVAFLPSAFTFKGVIENVSARIRTAATTLFLFFKLSVLIIFPIFLFFFIF